MGDHQSSAENGRHVPMGAKLRLPTWNCGGTDLGYDILALTETHDAGYLRPNKHFITGDTAPTRDRYAGVAMLLSDRVAGSAMHNGCCGSRRVATNRCVWRAKVASLV